MHPSASPTEHPAENEKQRQLLASAKNFAQDITLRWPQLDTSSHIVVETDDHGSTVELPPFPASMEVAPALHYYFAGSLATMLLAQADGGTFQEVDEHTGMPLAESITMPRATQQTLQQFARPIGDLDFVETAAYALRKSHLWNLYKTGVLQGEAHNEERRKYLYKGGGGPRFDDLSEKSLFCLRREPGQLSIMCDPVAPDGAHHVARISVDGRQYFIARPDTLLSFKVLHMLQSYHQKPESFAKDFTYLYDALFQIYGEAALIASTREVLEAYDEKRRAFREKWKDTKGGMSSADIMKEMLVKEEVPPSIKVFLEKLL